MAKEIGLLNKIPKHKFYYKQKNELTIYVKIYLKNILL